MSKQPRWILFLAACVMASAGCDINAYVPTAEKLRRPDNPSSAFIVEEQGIIGIYGNLDVDSAIYSYVSGIADEAELWTEIDAQASQAGWELRDEHGEYRRYVRIRPKPQGAAVHSLEEVRIARREQGDVLIAWVRTDDSDELPDDFPEDGAESNFAKRVVWPRFAAELAGTAGD